MQLSEHDLKQLDEEYLRSLSPDSLQLLSLKLLGDLKEAHDRLNQNPENSSRPPSSRAPWEGGSDAGGDDVEEQSPSPKQEQESDAGANDEDSPSQPRDEAVGQDRNKDSAAMPAGKAGKRQGAPGYGRTVVLPVSAERIHRPSVCAACGVYFLEDAPFRAYTARYEIDVGLPSSGAPGLELIHTKHVHGECQCTCGHWTRQAPGRCRHEADWSVELTEWHLVGPTLVGLLCALSLRLRLSRARIQEFLHDWLGLDLSVGTIHQCLHEAGRATAPVVEEEVLTTICQSALVHADETGWKEHGRALWLWVFTCTTATFFVVGRRTRELVERILGQHFAGWLMSDGYCAYREYSWRLRCFAHIMRKARGLEQSLDGLARDFGTRAAAVLETVMAAVYQAREGPPPQGGLRAHLAPVLNAFLAECEQHRNASHEKTRALAREFLNDWDTYWAVLDHPSLPLTNNEAERALRHWVIARRISYGTRTPEGSRAFAALASVIETCRKRGVSPWPYLAEVIRKRRRDEPAPPLPQPVV
jgi:hypothetical protein